MRYLNIFLLLFATAISTGQSVPKLVNYQGQLTDSQGNPAVGDKKIEFNIYDDATGGTLLWGPQTFDNVTLINGEFNVVLGMDTQNRSVDTAFSSDNAFLGMKVGDAGGSVGAEFSPRQQFLAVPYAFRSLDSDSSSNADLEARIDALENSLFPPGSATVSKSLVLGLTPFNIGTALDSEGNSYLTTRTNQPLDFGDAVLQSMNDDATRDTQAPFLVKFDPQGNHLWSFLITNSTTTFTGNLQDVAVDLQDNVIVVGRVEPSSTLELNGTSEEVATEDSLFIGKFTKDGTKIWTRAYPGTGSIGTVIADSQNDLIISGSYSTNFTLGSDFLQAEGKSDFFIAKIDGSNGDPVWANGYGSTDDDEVTGIDLASNGEILVAGVYQGVMQMGIVQLSHHGAVSNTDYFRIFIARLNPSNGNTVWANGYASSTVKFQRDDWTSTLREASDGTLFLPAHFVGGRDDFGAELGVDLQEYMGVFQFASNGDFIDCNFWQLFTRDYILSTLVEDDIFVNFYQSTISSIPINYGGLDVGTGMTNLFLRNREIGLTHGWSNSLGGNTTARRGDVDYRDGKIALARISNDTEAFGNSEADVFLAIIKP